jgi:hypothetical protein
VLNAVVAFKIASILESDPKLANENIVNGIALFVIANKNECFHIGLSRSKYFFLNNIGTNIEDAIINLACTSAIAPNSGAATFINIKALPQIAPNKINKNQ